MGQFWDQSGHIWAHLEAWEQDIVAILGMISPLSLAQHNLNAPKLFTVALTINTQNSVALGSPFVTILDYSEPILRPQSKIFVIFGTILSFLLSKWV